MKDVLTLCYHAVSDAWPAPLAVTPDALERQLAALVARGYRGATFNEALTRPPGEPIVAVTFDDSYRSVRELAHPILRQLGIPATVFVPTAFAGSERPMSWPGIEHWVGGSHEHELIPMSWEELGELAGDGWEIGSHTRTHPRLPGLDPASLREELEGSRAECEARLGARCTSLAYPYGDCDAAVVAAARDAGYTAAGAITGRVRRPGRLLWPRTGIYRTESDLSFRLKVSPAMRRLRASPAWGLRFLLRRLRA